MMTSAQILITQNIVLETILQLQIVFLKSFVKPIFTVLILTINPIQKLFEID